MKNKSNKKDFKNFGILIGIILLIITGINYWNKNEMYQIFLLLSFTIIFFGLLFPIVLKPFYLLWMFLGNFIGKIMTPLILIILFYFIITPFSFIWRIFGNSSIATKPEKSVKTYWNYKLSSQSKLETYKKQY